MPATTIVYLTGFGRSGSTLVERLLGSAPGWTNVGELVDLARSVGPTDERCGCGERFSACPLWTEVGDLAFGGWSSEVWARLAGLQRTTARQRHLPSLLSGRAPSAALRELRAAYGALYAAVATVTGSRVVVDASKGPALGAALAGAPDLDVRLLNVVRDPRAVAWSWQRSVERPHVEVRGTGGTEEMWRIPVSRSAAQWAALQAEVALTRRRTPVPSARVRYEDVVADPVGALARATTELRLPLGARDLPAVSGAGVDLAPSHGLSGNPGRFRSGVVPLRRDDAWMTEMPGSDRALATVVTLPLLTTYGYPAGTTSTARAARGPRASWSST